MTKHHTHHPQLMLVILPEFAADIKREVKYWGDIKRSVPTQCVVSLSSTPTFVQVHV